VGGNLAVERFAFSVSMSLCSVNASSMVDRVVYGASRYRIWWVLSVAVVHVSRMMGEDVTG
jgi:hypothetical protein